MVEEIQKYLQGENPDFNQGFALYCKYSRNESLISWIGRKRDMTKLIYELKKMNEWPGELPLNRKYEEMEVRYNHFRTPESEQKKAEDFEVKFKTFDERRTKRGDLPENLQKVYDDIADDYKIRKGYHEKMKMATADKDRAEFRKKIMETQERIVAGWKVIDQYLLEKDKKNADDNFKESTCRSYVTKMLKHGSLTPEQIEKLRVRVDALVKHDCKFSEDIQMRLEALKIL